MEYKYDNRYAVGGSGAILADDPLPRAWYSARWIDRADWADILPDRQGFACNDEADKHELQDLLSETQPHRKVASLDYDWTEVIPYDGFTIAMRRCGGYIYVDAWLTEEN